VKIAVLDGPNLDLLGVRELARWYAGTPAPRCAGAAT